MDRREYANLILLAFQSKESLARAKAEEQLVQVCQNDANSIDQLSQISCQKNDSNLAEAAALTIITIIKKLIANTKPYPLELRLHHVELFIQILKCDVSEKVKQSIKIALQTLINYDKQNHFTSRLQAFVEQSVETKQEHALVAALYVADCLSLEKQHSWFQAIINIGLIRESLSISTQQLWSSVLYSALDKHLHTKQLSGLPEPIQEFFIYNENLCKVVSSLHLNLNGGDQKFQGKIIASLYLLYFSIIVQYQEQIRISQCPFMGILNSVTDLIIKNLITFTLSPQFDPNNMSQDQTRLINEMIKFLAVVCKCALVYSIMTEARMAILLDVVYPFFASTSKELEDLVDDPNEFVQLAQDVLDEQKSDIPKTSVAKLILAMNSNIDGSTSFFTSFAALTSTYCLQEITSIDMKEQLGIFKELKEHYFLRSMNINIVLETSIFILALLSYQLQNRLEAAILFRSFLLQYGNYLFNYSIPIVQTRLCLFIGSYCTFLLKEQDDLSGLLLNFLNAQIKTSYFICPAKCYCAIEAIKNIIEEPRLSDLLEPMSGQFLLSLCETLAESDFSDHFDTIKSIFKTFKIDESVLEQALTLIVYKINIEQKKVEQGQQERQILINLSWNILKTLPEIESIIPKHFELVESTISTLYKYLQNPLKIDFDEDIIYLISQLISKTQLVSEHQTQIFYYCESILSKQHNMLGQLFEWLNYLIRYGTFFFSKIQIQQHLLQILSQVFNDQKQTESSQCEAILLLHLLVQEYHLQNEILSQIFQAVFDRSKSVVKNDFFRSRLMGVFISGFIINCQQTIDLVSSQNFLFDHLVNSYQYCQPDYDVKLYVNGFCIFLLKNISLFSKEILSNLVCLLKKQYHHELNKKESEEDDDMFTFNEELEDSKISMETFLSKIKSIDEFGVFYLTYQQLKTQIDIGQFIASDLILKSDLDELLKINKFNNDPRVIMKLKKRKQAS